jgi:hypothetical protein
MSSGRFRITNCYLDSGFAGGLSGATLDHNVFNGTFEPIDDPGYTPASVSRVVIHQAKARSDFAAWHGSATDVYTYMDTFSAPASPKFWRIDPGSTQTGWIFEYGSGSASTGATCLEANGKLAAGSITVQNAIVLRAAQSTANASCRAVHSGTTADTWNLYHSTLVFGPGSALYYDTGAANKVANVKGNLFVDLLPYYGTYAPRSNPLGTGAPATAPLNHFSASGIADNSVFNQLPVTRWTSSYGSCAGAACTSNGTPYDVPVNGTIPGAGDVAGDPNLFWRYQRNYAGPGFREWAHVRYSIGYDTGTSYVAGNTANGEFEAIGGDVNLAAAIDNLFAYIRQNWAPVNNGLKGAGHDGQDIGAAPVRELKYRAYSTKGLADGNSFEGTDAWGLYFENGPRLAGSALGFDAVLMRLNPGSPATVPGLATNCYVFVDGDVADQTLLGGAAIVDGCVFDIGGTARNVSMVDSRAAPGGVAASHSIVLPAIDGSFAGPIASGATGTFKHNTCWSKCFENPAVQASRASNIEWPPAQTGPPDPLWYDYKRNLALFDSKYLGNTAPPWSGTRAYSEGDFVSHSRAGLYWGEAVNFRYTNIAGCGDANPEPMIASNWRTCWEYASMYRIRRGLPDPTANPPRSTLDVYDDQKIGAHGDDPVTTLIKWVRAGYAPTNPTFAGSGADAYDGGAMPVFFSAQLTQSPRSMTAARAATIGGVATTAGRVKVQR